MKLLMIEDCQAAISKRREALARAGWDVSSARTLRAAQWFYENQRGQWDVITFDFALPKFEGNTTQGNTIPLILEADEDRRCRNCHTLLIAASSMEKCRLEQISAGCDDSISDAGSYVSDVLDFCNGYFHSGESRPESRPWMPSRYRGTHEAQEELHGWSQTTLFA